MTTTRPHESTHQLLEGVQRTLWRNNTLRGARRALWAGAAVGLTAAGFRLAVGAPSGLGGAATGAAAIVILALVATAFTHAWLRGRPDLATASRTADDLLATDALMTTAGELLASTSGAPPPRAAGVVLAQADSVARARHADLDAWTARRLRGSALAAPLAVLAGAIFLTALPAARPTPDTHPTRSRDAIAGSTPTTVREAHEAPSEGGFAPSPSNRTQRAPGPHAATSTARPDAPARAVAPLEASTEPGAEAAFAATDTRAAAGGRRPGREPAHGMMSPSPEEAAPEEALRLRFIEIERGAEHDEAVEMTGHAEIDPNAPVPPADGPAPRGAAAASVAQPARSLLSPEQRVYLAEYRRLVRNLEP